MFMIDQEEEKVGTFPAACQVDPAVSSFFSSSSAVRPARLRQMIKRRGADRPAPDDDHPRLRKIRHRPPPPPNCAHYLPPRARFQFGHCRGIDRQSRSRHPFCSNILWGSGGRSAPGACHQAQRPSMQIDLLDTFLDLAETRSYHRTAERLRVTQSTVSARVTALEQAVGLAPLQPLPRRDRPYARGQAVRAPRPRAAA
jgi:hypothetical protein